MRQRIGTIIHGALGDCYEQLLVLRLLKARHPEWSFIGFFAVKERMSAMLHFKLDMLDEVHGADTLAEVNVDAYFQMQVRDRELREEVINYLPVSIQSRFDLMTNHKPWVYLRRHDFRQSGLKLELSERGIEHLERCFELNRIDRSLFGRKLTVGFLWRYRRSGEPVRAAGQRDRVKLLAEMSQLLNQLIKQYDAHILVCGMAQKDCGVDAAALMRAREAGGVVMGEVNDKFAKEKLSVPDAHCTYLNGLGYAAEMEIMAQCDVLLLMASGFSEPLWMRREMPVVLIAPPPDYLLKLLWNRMPFFDNTRCRSLLYNVLASHFPSATGRFLQRENMIKIRQR